MSEAGGPPAAVAPLDPERLLLRLEGFEGPLDLLLELARGQKLDLAGISILALVDQYLAVVEGARRIRLELAADWLVMAAWLTWLKSRLLLPAGEAGAEEAEIAADVLAARLQVLQTMRSAAAWLGARPQLGHDMFRRGLPETLVATDRSELAADLPALVRGYLEAMRRVGARRRYRPKPMTMWSVQEALQRLERMLGSLPDWTSLVMFLPEDHVGGPLQRRAAMAATLLAGLEMARGGGLLLRQEAAFGPILVRRGVADIPPDEAGPDEAGEGSAA